MKTYDMATEISIIDGEYRELVVRYNAGMISCNEYIEQSKNLWVHEMTSLFIHMSARLDDIIETLRPMEVD